MDKEISSSEEDIISDDNNFFMIERYFLTAPKKY